MIDSKLDSDDINMRVVIKQITYKMIVIEW